MSLWNENDVGSQGMVAPGAFLQNVEDAQFDRIASGHYARVEHAAINGDFVGARLLLSADQVVKHLVYLTTFPQISLSPQSILLLVCVDFGCSESMGILVSWKLKSLENSALNHNFWPMARPVHVVCVILYLWSSMVQWVFFSAYLMWKFLNLWSGQRSNIFFITFGPSTAVSLDVPNWWIDKGQ